jgi:hypothetical protein
VSDRVAQSAPMSNKRRAWAVTSIEEEDEEDMGFSGSESDDEGRGGKEM